MRLTVALLLSVAICAQALPVAENKGFDALARDRPVCDSQGIAQVNLDANSTWTARESSVFADMTMAQFKKSMLGLRIDRSYTNVPIKSHRLLEVELPEEFNSYEAWPHYMHPIRDQMR